MKIIILGAGQVGGTLAEHLANERNDITVVDTDGDQLRKLKDRLDIGTVTGSASYPQVLRDAGAEDAEMLVAVTRSHTPSLEHREKSHAFAPSSILATRSSCLRQTTSLWT